MKKLLLTFSAIAGFAFMGSAQEFGFEKGNVILEGSFQASTLNRQDVNQKQHSISFTPKVGLFLTDRFALGLAMNLGNSKMEVDSGTPDRMEQSFRNLDAGAFGRYYFLELGSRFKTYAELGARYTTNRTYDYRMSAGGESESKNRGFATQAGVGANFFLTEAIAINFLFANILSFSTQKPVGDQANDRTSSTTSFSSNLNSFGNFFDTSSFGLTFKF